MARNIGFVYGYILGDQAEAGYLTEMKGSEAADIMGTKRGKEKLSHTSLGTGHPPPSNRRS